jgi:hypothetical protein
VNQAKRNFERLPKVNLRQLLTDLPAVWRFDRPIEKIPTKLRMQNLDTTIHRMNARNSPSLMTVSE